jgi:mRNA interferase MazF
MKMKPCASAEAILVPAAETEWPIPLQAKNAAVLPTLSFGKAQAWCDSDCMTRLRPGARLAGMIKYKSNGRSMQKDFDTWNDKKKNIDNDPHARVFFHIRELWFAHLGANVGFEQDGRGDEFLRPILVVRKFNNEVLWVVPLTKTEKPNNPYYADFQYAAFPEAEGATPSSSVAILSQLRLIDAKRLRYKLGTAHADEFDDLKEKIRRLLA